MQNNNFEVPICIKYYDIFRADKATYGQTLEILSESESFRGKFPVFVESRKILSTGEWKAESKEFPPPALESSLSEKLCKILRENT